MNINTGMMIKTTCLLAFLFVMCTTVSAQEESLSDKTPNEKAELITEKQKEKLNLDAAQEEAMYALNLKYINEMEDIMQAGRSFSTMRKLKKMRGEKDKEMKKVLTKEQYKIYEDLKKEIRDEMKAAIKERKRSN